MKSKFPSLKPVAIAVAAFLVLGLMASLSYAAVGAAHREKHASTAAPKDDADECATTQDGSSQDGSSQDGSSEESDDPGDQGEDGDDQGEDGDTEESDDQGDQGETTDTEESDDQGNQGEDCNAEDPEDSSDESTDASTDPVDPDREAACNEAAGVDPNAQPEPGAEPEKVTGLDNAIQHVLANCMKNPQAPGLVNALEHLVANQKRHELHDAWKAEHKHGKPPWAGGGPPPWAGGNKD